MDIETLRLFVDVAEKASFAAVAKERGLDPSSVSRAVALLEQELGLRLFQRSTRRMSLTEAGDLYLARIEPLIDEMERARGEAASLSAEPAGTLRVTASVTFGQRVIVPLLGAFRQLHPKVKVEANFTDANLDLVAERMDLAVRLAPLIEGDLIATRLMGTQYRAVASPAYLSRHAVVTTPSDLSTHSCLLFSLRAYRTRWLFRDQSGAESAVPIHGDITLSPAGSLRDAALAGLGIALLPDWLVDEDIEQGRLVRLLPAYDVTATSFDTAAWLIYPSRAFLPGKVRAMIDFLKERLPRPAESPSAATRSAPRAPASPPTPRVRSTAPR